MPTTTDASARPMTAEEFLALPDDGMDRMLIRGRLWEKPYAPRDRWHSRVAARVAWLLVRWRETLPCPRGAVYAGEAGFRLLRDPGTIVGIDVAFVSAETESCQPDDAVLIDGCPILAVEILSPADTLAEVAAKIDSYLEAGVPLVWVIDPHFRTVTVYRPGGRPRTFAEDDELTGDAHMPGFRVAVSQVFEG